MAKNFLVAGIEEAGRGPVIGPMVIAGISINSKKEALLKTIRVKDSKLLKKQQRERLVKRIEKMADDIVIIKVSPCRIDNAKRQGINLNRLEAMKMADIINFLDPDKAVVDCPDTNCRKFELVLKKMLKKETELVVEHKADKNHPIVSAASIIAKTARDEEIAKIKKKYGLKGMGYSHDEETIEWLREWLETHKEFPNFVRKSWSTARKLMAEKKQRKLSRFLGKFRKKPC